MKRNVNRHTGRVIICPKGDKTKYLFGGYDRTHPKKIFRGRISLIGGNYEKNDKSPLELFIREATEEFSRNQDYQDKIFDIPEKIEKFATEKYIKLIREAVINEARPYHDFYISAPQIRDVKSRNAIESVFVSQIPEDIFNLAQENLIAGNAIKNEGFARVTTVEELVSGKIINLRGTPEYVVESGRILGAGGTAPIMQEYLKKPIPNPENFSAQAIGTPRLSFTEYLKEFNYTFQLS